MIQQRVPQLARELTIDHSLADRAKTFQEKAIIHQLITEIQAAKSYLGKVQDSVAFLRSVLVPGLVDLCIMYL